jgi:hypothetical protein
MTPLSHVVEVRTEFGRSANIERDAKLGNPGYVPTARAREVIRRIASGILIASAGRAFSVTGTYGSGKSSLGLFASALFGPSGAAQQHAADALAAVDADLATLVEKSRASSGLDGLLIATVTARREAVTVTIARALEKSIDTVAVDEDSARLVRQLTRAQHPRSEDVLLALESLTQHHGVLLLIDEFGKNVEEFINSGTANSDLYVLQEIAEWAAQNTSSPLIMLLLQHLAFADYDAQGTSSKEWSKIQGRFSDIPYVESPSESQALMAGVFSVLEPIDKWVADQKLSMDDAGLSDLIRIALSSVFPLHPTTLIVLPDLCFRYGQNERTFFAFLAGPDAGAVNELLNQMEVSSETQLPSVRLHHLYDYFLASAANMVSSSPHASRWIEIETRLRDAANLSRAEILTLKAIAVLNLVSAGGAVRASRSVLRYAVADGLPGTDDFEAIDRILRGLEVKGFVTYREFADEFRIWSGTDFDFQSVVEAARRSMRGTSTAHLLNGSRPQVPAVASRHSQTTGVLRVFDRLFLDSATPPLETELGQDFDGLVVLCLGSLEDVLARPDVAAIARTRPLVIGVAENATEISDRTLELAAQREALRVAEEGKADWVAVREMRERTATATAALDEEIDALNSGESITWHTLIGGNAIRIEGGRSRPMSSVLSALCDDLYPDTPLIRNEMLSRRVLTSQGAKARRNLLQAMLDSPDSERCGIDGYPPERAMYEAVLGSSGLHRARPKSMCFGAPALDDPLRYGATWALIEECFKDARNYRMGLKDVYLRLMQPPVGLKEGPIPILLVAALIEHCDEVAIYEDGTFVPRLDIITIERMIRNPDNFAIQSYTLSGSRRLLAEAVVARLRASTKTPRNTRLASVVTAVGPLMTRVKSLPEHALKTKEVTQATADLRAKLVAAREPDTLLFTDIPAALGHPVIDADAVADVDAVVEGLFTCLSELEAAHGKVLVRVHELVRTSLAVGTADTRRELRDRFSHLRSEAFEPDTTTLIAALVDDHLGPDDWLGYLGMITIGKPTLAWTDQDALVAFSKLSQGLLRIRNLESLPTEVRVGRTPVRLALTARGGVEEQRIVWLLDAQSARLREIVDGAVSQAMQDLGGHAAEALLAEMTLALLGPARTITPSKGSSRRGRGGK